MARTYKKRGSCASMALVDRSITLLEKVGSGGFGEVWRCHFEGGTYAAKVVATKRLHHGERALVSNELAVWSALRHENLVHLERTWSTPSSIVFLCELMDESLGDVHRRMSRSGTKPRMLPILNHLLSVCSGMGYLHGHGIVHRDLKSDNVMVRDGVTKVSDFGLARHCGGDMTAETGSYRWMAPEVIRHEQYGPPCDLYSFAMLAYEMVTLTYPFQNMSPVEAAFAVARDGERPPLPRMPDGARTLIESCWAQSAKDRPSFSDLEPRLLLLRSKKESFSSV